MFFISSSHGQGPNDRLDIWFLLSKGASIHWYNPGSAGISGSRKCVSYPGVESPYKSSLSTSHLHSQTMKFPPPFTSGRSAGEAVPCAMPVARLMSWDMMMSVRRSQGLGSPGTSSSRGSWWMPSSIARLLGTLQWNLTTPTLPSGQTSGSLGAGKAG